MNDIVRGIEGLAEVRNQVGESDGLAALPSPERNRSGFSHVWLQIWSEAQFEQQSGGIRRDLDACADLDGVNSRKIHYSE